MAVTKNTGWINVSDGDTTQLDLSGYNKIVSAKIRWQGVETIDTNFVVDDTTNSFPGRIVNNYPSDYPSTNTAFADMHYYGRIDLKNNGTTTKTYNITFEKGLGNAVTKSTTLDPGETDYLIEPAYFDDNSFFGEQIALEYDCSQVDVVSYILKGYIFYDQYYYTENPSVAINGSTTSYTGVLGDGEVTSWQSLSGLTAEQINDVSHSISAPREAYYEIEYTVEPRLPKPTNLFPSNQAEKTNESLYFEMTLTEDTDNSATEYHARLQIGENPGPDNIYQIYESKESQSEWELWDGSSWISFPSVGVAPGSKVRVQPTSDLNYDSNYWDVASYDGTAYGFNSDYRKLKVLISTTELYALRIEGTEYNVYSLSVSETSNGEIGSIRFTLNNENNTANTNINYGDEVLLAVNDILGNTEQFKGRVKKKNPSGNVLEITALTGGGILSERIIDKDYSSQDIGLIAKDIIDNYCAPLTSFNINTSTGITAPITAIDKKPLKVFEDMRRQHDIYYFIDKDWDVHFYVESAISEGNIEIKRGGY